MTTLQIIITILVGILLVIVCAYKLLTHNISEEQQLVQLLHYYKEWNDRIQTKQALLDFYQAMNETSREVWNTDFKLQITRDEFNQLPVETLKRLNDQALESLINNIQKKRE